MNGGFEKQRNIKILLSCRTLWIILCWEKECPLPKSIIVGLSEDKRRFVSLPRLIYKWERKYSKRTVVEKVNILLDTSYGFENYTKKGQDKMELQESLSTIVILTMAVGKIKEKQKR